MSVGRYRKRPVVVEAVCWLGDNVAELHGWPSGGPRVRVDGGVLWLWVDANGAWLPLVVGEWVLRDRLGFYPCKADVFADTYVAV